MVYFFTKWCPWQSLIRRALRFGARGCFSIFSVRFMEHLARLSLILSGNYCTFTLYWRLKATRGVEGVTPSRVSRAEPLIAVVIFAIILRKVHRIRASTMLRLSLTLQNINSMSTAIVITPLPYSALLIHCRPKTTRAFFLFKSFTALNLHGN